MPGRIPAANSLPIEAPVRYPKMIMGMDGGMITPIDPPAAWTAGYLSQGVGVEIMDTAAACRTYNVLQAEGRPVAAAILAVD